LETLSRLTLGIPIRLAESEFVNLLRNPGIDSQPGGPVRQSYLTNRPIRAQEESDPAGVILCVMDGPYRLLFPYRTAVALTRAAQCPCCELMEFPAAVYSDSWQSELQF
jgi:hypothetical protein